MTAPPLSELERAVLDALRAGEFEFGPARRSQVFAGHKVRQLTALSGLDKLAHTLLARHLREHTEALVDAHVRSFKKGDSSQRTVADLARFTRAFAKRHPRRGLFVLRADVAEYGDSIPVHAQAPLWPLLDALWATLQRTDEDAWFLAALRPALRCEVVERDGARLCQLVGLPTGSPLLPPIENLYLAEIDRELGAHTDAFYARYGDDIIFAHPDAALVARSSAAMLAMLARLGLRVNTQKLQHYHFNAAGAPWAGPQPEVPFRPSNSVEYLGYRVRMSGTVSLTQKKWRELIGFLRRGLRDAVRNLTTRGPTDRARVLCALLGQAANKGGLLAHRHVVTSLAIVNDRAQLGELDYFLALSVAELAVRRRGVRAFREMPYRRLKRELGLPSLVMLRNGRRQKLHVFTAEEER